MKYPQIQGLEDEKFRRLTGVKRSTFEKMISILKEYGYKEESSRWSKEQIMYRRSATYGSGIYS